METIYQRKAHHGHSVKRLREILGVKQDAIAIELDVTQPYISELEQKDVIDDKVLEKIAKVLNVPVDTIKDFNEEYVFNIINNTFNSNDTSIGNQANYQCTFNPVDKIVELYERIVKEKEEKNALLEQLLKEKKK